MKKVCVITGSRAEYGLLYHLMREIEADPGMQLRLIVTGMHLSQEYGSTYKVIEEDGFGIDGKVEMPIGDSAQDTAVSISAVINGVSGALKDLEPDIVVVNGDRYEIFAASTAALLAKIPIAHIHGGEATYGAFDDAFRHAITKMSLLHFTSTEEYRRRVIQMGEAPDRVFNVGAPSLENIRKTRLLSREELEERLGIKLGKPLFLLTYHPTTLGSNSSSKSIGILLEALDSFPEATIIFTHPNADPDNHAIGKAIDLYAEKSRGRCASYQSLGACNYFSAMKYADVVIGNSSSGIIEAPTFRVPTVNIGDRQRGRLMAKSVINCDENMSDIKAAISKALSCEFRDGLDSLVNPYGDGDDVSEKIKNVIKDVQLTSKSAMKEFYDLKYADQMGC